VDRLRYHLGHRRHSATTGCALTGLHASPIAGLLVALISALMLRPANPAHLGILTH
jgi:hypothetical protein